MSPRVFFDVSTTHGPIGRLTFALAASSLLPKHVENVRRLCTGECSGLDPALTYERCVFEYSPSYVLGPQYKWCRVLKGRGRNAIGRATEAIADAPALARCARDGPVNSRYYGLLVEDQRMVLTVPVEGPGRGLTRLAVVRVADSPPSWQQRLLLNSAVIGVLDDEDGEAAVQALAVADSPPFVAGCGELT